MCLFFIISVGIGIVVLKNNVIKGFKNTFYKIRLLEIEENFVLIVFLKVIFLIVFFF